MAASSPPEKLQKPNKNHTSWLLRRVWDRVNRNNEHFMGCIVGREGSGKSYTAIKIANTVDSSFNADRIIFDVADLLEDLRDGDHQPGDFYVLDEAGVQFGVRTWQDRAQVLANQALQLIRSHNLGLIFTLPRLSELDSQAEGRLQAILEMTEKRPDEYVRLKWKWLDPDRIGRNGTVLKKYPRRVENGYKKRVKRNTFGPPEDEELIANYEERKESFQEGVYDETIKMLKDEKEEEEEESKSPKDIADEILDEGTEFVTSEHGNTGEPYIDKDLIRAEYEISHADASAVKSLLEQRSEVAE